MNIRENYENIEEQILSPYACKSSETKGRKIEIEKCSIRTDFQRDRDRINHSKSFRRLMHKTQVYISPEGDHYRTRLTHTLEVNQIARTISRALRLNEDLTEAIAFGHDIGHTPFGHTGEDAVNKLMADGFEHNKQSVRVVTKLENNGAGLNLTQEVIDGILNHRGKGSPYTLEGMVVQLSDKIAYINHDIDDAIRAGVIHESDLPKQCSEMLGTNSSARINFLIRNVIENSIGQNFVSLTSEVKTIFMLLRKHLFSTIYKTQLLEEERAKIQRMLSELFEYYLKNLELLPPDYFRMLNEESKERVVCDYIAGMTDRFAMNKFKTIFIPTSWGKFN